MIRFPRTPYIPTGAVKVADKASDAVAYIYTDKRGRPCAVIYYGKQTKAVGHLMYRSEAAREASVARYFTARRESAAGGAARRAELKAKTAAARATVQVGDIFNTNWGYDQTNIEFFEVVEVRGAYAILREIASASEERGQEDACVPQSGAFLSPRYEGDDRGLPIRRLIQGNYYGAGCYFRIDDVRTASAWGRRVAGVVVGDACHRTASGYGH